MPSALRNQFKRAIIAAGVDAAMFNYAFPYQRVMLTRAIQWAARTPPLLEVRAPMCVQSTVTRQVKDGERLLIHLFNNVNTTAGMGLPAEEVPLREETIPIHDIGVTFDAGYAIKRVHLEPGGTEMAITKVTGGVSVTVPRLDVHAVVVAELQ